MFLTNGFFFCDERADVFDERVTKPVERTDVFDEWMTKPFERADVFDERMNVSIERMTEAVQTDANFSERLTNG